MNMKFSFIIALTIIFSLIIVGCTTPSDSGDAVDNSDGANTEEAINEDADANEDTSDDTDSEVLDSRDEELDEQENSNGPSSDMSLLQTSLIVMDLIKEKEMENLADYVHPDKGLRFTPYFYVDTQNDQVFNTQQVEVLDQDNSQYTWGEFDGRGDPIEYNFNEYYDEFVYDEDYINPHIIGNNTAIGSGNTTDNVATAYPEGKFVEFHFTGFDPQYTGMDWSSLRLVFEEHAGAWYLVGVVHGQWTI